MLAAVIIGKLIVLGSNVIGIIGADVIDVLVLYIIKFNLNSTLILLGQKLQFIFILLPQQNHWN